MMTSVEVVVGEEGATATEEELTKGPVVVLGEEGATAAVEVTGMREELTMVEARSVMAGETISVFATLAIAAMAVEVAAVAMAAVGEVAVVTVAAMGLAGALLAELSVSEVAEGAIAEVVAEVAMEAAICTACFAEIGIVSVGAILDCEG